MQGFQSMIGSSHAPPVHPVLPDAAMPLHTMRAVPHPSAHQIPEGCKSCGFQSDAVSEAGVPAPVPQQLQEMDPFVSATCAALRSSVPNSSYRFPQFPFARFAGE